MSTAIRWIPLLVFVCPFAVGACSDHVGPDEEERRQPPFALFFTADQDFGSHKLGCSLSGLVRMDAEVTPGATVTGVGRIDFQRRAYRGPVTVQAAGSWDQQTVLLEFTDSASVRLILNGVVSDTLFGHQRGPSVQGWAFGGKWDCTPDLPFTTDSLLAAAGWTSSIVISGYWDFDETQLYVY
jgi:hypothetical protein